MPANPPVVRSVSSAPRVSTPWRSRNDSVRACARRVASASRSGTSDQRPAAVGGPVREGMVGRPTRA